ncbi:MAG: MaoC family dehydratase [Actinobacteria bacterium]|nr:MaoC family dehydratase [Actinomycetota bacterium]
MNTHLDTPRDLLERVGQPLGETEWYEITQHQVDQFADATRDHQWIHVNPAQAAAGPFGGPVAHGFLTLSLVPLILGEVVAIDQVRTRVNYGLNKVRFTAPVPVGAEIRGVVSLLGATEKSGGVEAVFSITVELKGSERPAMIAESVILYL